MKEAPTKSLPPKISSLSGSGDGTPVKNSSSSGYARNNPTNDEILSTLLRINNFDSISSIKDESLDIDLSACVTISDPSGIINGNSLSSSDFWRVLDESAQTPGQLDMSCTANGDDSYVSSSNILEITTSNEANLAFIVKSERPSSFSGTFLRPEPPSLMSISPLKKSSKSYALDHVQKPKVKSVNSIMADHILTERKKAKLMSATAALMVKQEPPEQLLADDDSAKGNYSSESSEDLSSMISKHSFSLIVSPGKNKNTCFLNKSPEATGPSIPMRGTENNRPITDIQIKSSSSTDAVAEESTAPVQSSEPLFECEDCGGLLLRGLLEYAVHEAQSHKILHKCVECQKLFDNETGLKKHVKAHRTVVPRKDAWKKCPDCGKCLKLGSMWMHRKIHSDNKKYGCDICGQKFLQKINLTHHSRVHTSEKPYECPECQKRFQERSHLQRHQKYHAQTRSYRCEKCGKMYKTERCLKVHNLVHLEQRPFACNVCDKSFISNSKLKQHSNIHTGERPFKCNYCPRDFTNFPNWLKHTRRRHKVDHKTGEHLENIPSYCSKKSSKSSNSSKVEKTQPSSTTKTSISTQVTVSVIDGNDAGNGGETPIVKPQTKRKKKATVQQTECAPHATLSATTKTTTQNGLLNQVANISTTQNISTSFVNNVAGVTAAPTKVVKVKRERKQSTPKQVHKTTNSAPVIKKEIVDCVEQAVMEEPSTTKTGSTSFPDLHCLSITSAEELIMEQALEMEECGLYDRPASSRVLETDNAVSAESVAALHFQIKNEFIDIKEEYATLAEEASNRLLCSSLESSPYSSPASTSGSLPVVAPNITITKRVLGQQMPTPTTTAAYYMPPFGLSNTGSSINSTSASDSPTLIAATTATNRRDATIRENENEQSVHQQLIAPLSNAQAVLSQLYVPVTMNMPILIQPQSTTQQVLPSVNTLLFTHANAFFRGKSFAPATARDTS